METVGVTTGALNGTDSRASLVALWVLGFYMAAVVVTPLHLCAVSATSIIVMGDGGSDLIGRPLKTSSRMVLALSMVAMGTM